MTVLVYSNESVDADNCARSLETIESEPKKQ